VVGSGPLPELPEALPLPPPVAESPQAKRKARHRIEKDLVMETPEVVGARSIVRDQISSSLI
jgi:hypothetical protein